MKSFQHCRDLRKTGQNFIPAIKDHVITALVSSNIYQKFMNELYASKLTTS